MGFPADEDGSADSTRLRVFGNPLDEGMVDPPENLGPPFVIADELKPLGNVLLLPVGSGVDEGGANGSPLDTLDPTELFPDEGV